MRTHKMWTRTDSRKPPDNTEVETKIDDERGIRNECTLRYHHNMWWCSDEMHTYYEPTHWRYI
jgi:hypothetical protein